jgi:pilus assembly protein CpaB
VTASMGKTFMVVAVLLGAGAAVVGYYGLSSMASEAAAQNDRNYRDVVVTATDLTFGVKLDPSQLRVVRYPRESVPEGAFASLDSVVGQTTKVFMSAREPVTAIKLSSRGGGLSMLVRKDMRAASLEVNQVSGVSGFVLPGDRVDVLVTVDAMGGGADAVTRTVLQNAEVLASGQKTAQQDNKPITVQSVTLLLDPRGAETLALAMHEGRIHLVLRNPEDQSVAPVASLSTRELLGAEAASRPAAGPRRAFSPNTPYVAQQPTASRDPGKVRIIRSANVTETPAVADSTRN